MGALEEEIGKLSREKKSSQIELEEAKGQLQKSRQRQRILETQLVDTRNSLEQVTRSIFGENGGGGKQFS